MYNSRQKERSGVGELSYSLTSQTLKMSGFPLTFNEKCKELALQYTSRRQFKLDYSGAFNASHRRGWIDEICSHMKMAYKPTGYWTYENCKKEAIKYKSSHQFKLNCQYAWATACKNKWKMDYRS